MSRFPRLARLAAVCALSVSTLSVVAASPAGAATGSLAAASNGVTVTWSGSTSSDHAEIQFRAPGFTCTSTDSPGAAIYFQSGDASNPTTAMIIPASPALYTFGSPTYRVSSTPYVQTVAAGSYTVCLYSVTTGPQGAKTVLSQLAVTIVDPSATTTTTAAPTTTTTAGSGATTTIAGATATTAVAGDPVAPAYTG